jgi:hypothetical protein
MKHEKVKAALPDTLFAGVSPKILELDPRRPFRAPDEGLDEVVYVCTGLLAIYRTDNSGHRAIVALRYPNEVILAGGRAPGSGVMPIVRSSVAISTSAVNGTAMCLALTQHNEAIAQVWLARAHLDADARIAHLLCETAIRSGQGIGHMDCPFTQEHMAEITGQTSVNVNRVLADLERQGLIERQGRSVTFLDWHELARMGDFRANYLGQ